MKRIYAVSVPPARTQSAGWKRVALALFFFASPCLLCCHRVHQSGYGAVASLDARRAQANAVRVHLLQVELGTSRASGLGATVQLRAISLGSTPPRSEAQDFTSNELSGSLFRISALGLQSRAYLVTKWEPTCTHDSPKPCDDPSEEALNYSAGVFGLVDALAQAVYSVEGGSLLRGGEEPTHGVWDPEAEVGVFGTLAPPASGFSVGAELQAGGGHSRIQGYYAFVRLELSLGGFRIR